MDLEKSLWRGQPPLVPPNRGEMEMGLVEVVSGLKEFRGLFVLINLLLQEELIIYFVGCSCPY